LLDAIRTLWNYNFWAQDKVFSALTELTEEEFLRDLGDGNGSIRDKLAHICGADEVWLRRIQGVLSPQFPAKDEFSSKEILIERYKRIREEYRALIEAQTETGLGKSHSYRNLKGVEFTTPLDQILLHVANHATYHRGQVASLIRRVKGKPPVTDLIEFFRL